MDKFALTMEDEYSMSTSPGYRPINPEFFDSESKQKKVFKFLRKALARLATAHGWTLRPGED